MIAAHYGRGGLEGVDANHDKWIWHPEWTLGETGFPIIVYDVNKDGKWASSTATGMNTAFIGWNRPAKAASAPGGGI